MSKTLQILIGAACLVVILGGAWIGYSQYSAHAEATRFQAASSLMDDKRTVHQCNELMRRPDLVDAFVRAMCDRAKRKVAEAE